MAQETYHGTVAKIARLLEFVARRGGCTVRDIVQDAGIPQSTTYQLIAGLTAEGYLLSRGHGKGYVLGPALVRLVHRAGSVYPDLADVAGPIVQAAAEELSETVKLTRREGFSAYVAAVGIPTQKYRITVEVGETFPLHAGAAGKTLLALESAALFEEVLSGELETFTSRTVTDSEEIRAQAAEIRRRGFAEDFGEYDPHIHAVAFPLDTHTPEGPYALSIPYLAPIDEERRGVLIERGRATAAAIIAVWEESSRRP